ncbi:MAG TPA: NAD(P)H-dependent oxidoreductase subunit E [Anaerolinea thermolimosa]|uniref:NAD(P)H-dependent oxidoreductase subunit E n=1 Tax=Anaerolinea thermolimosa TaxID=229919 RepID=A0A3D1JJF4_9CHLR|nr:NAD(P)H-dependent oxidoreductase subunit E [Anaerolinea thermolimosa]GAP07390.1 NADH dehydrogenase subunit E [Anaerolinea thermolimosa]HCE18642.1 NAD(P)H-dependent oxidoreductase subunit E [Anaerolinea thermolimosa]
MNQLLQKYPEEVQQILAKYPPEFKRSAVMPLLYLAQREANYVPRQALQDIAEILEISTTDVASIVGFYTLYYDEPGGRYRIQVCTDLPCALRGADRFLQELCERLGIEEGGTTPDGLFTVEAVKCLAACHRAPVFQVQGDGEIVYHENQSVELAMAWIEEVRARVAAKEDRS